MKLKYLLIIYSLLVIVLPNVWSTSEIESHLTDEEIRQKVVGTWIVDIHSPSGVVVKGIVTINSDNSLTSNGTITKGENSQEIRYSGTWLIKDGYLVETITKSNNSKFVPTDFVTRDKIISVDDFTLTYQTENGEIVTRKRGK